MVPDRPLYVFLTAYLEAISFTEEDTWTEEGVTPLIDEMAYQEALRTSFRFYRWFRKVWRQGGWSDTAAAHDFWLTRNGAGVGFWSRDEGDDILYPAYGALLSTACELFGTSDCTVDNNKLYLT
jgi:hypothetical protein